VAAESVILLAALLAMQPDPAMLRRLFEEALQRRQQEFGADDLRTAQAARDLGLFLSGQGDARSAQPALAQALLIDEKQLGPEAAQTLADAADLAAASPPASAEPLWKRAAASKEPHASARAFKALGAMRQAAGDAKGAAGFYRLALTKEQGAPAAMTLNTLAPLVPLREGIVLLERALAIDRRVLGARHPETASTEANLAGLLLNAGRTEESIRAIRDAIAIFEETLGVDDPRVAISSMILADGLRVCRADAIVRAGPPGPACR
jgi:tetratricopeptide (TPR) repeat protein